MVSDLEIWYHSDSFAIKVSRSCRMPENWVRCCVKCTKRSLATRPWPKEEAQIAPHKNRGLEVGGAGSAWQHASVQPNLGSTEVEMEKLKVEVKSQQARLWCAMAKQTQKKMRFCLANSHIRHIPKQSCPTWTHLDIPSAWINMNWMDYGDVRWHWLCSQLS
jgi:hypothetical protein